MKIDQSFHTQKVNFSNHANYIFMGVTRVTWKDKQLVISNGKSYTAALFVCEDGPRTTLTCQKKNYIKNYFKLIYFVTILT